MIYVYYCKFVYLKLTKSFIKVGKVLKLDNKYK